MTRIPQRLRLLHFDLKTVYSYGDQLLFELVREAFNAYGGGAYFDVSEAVPFRDAATPELIERINSEFDGVLIGGGGLFPRRTNVAEASGWQWDISIDLLRRIEKPIIVFGAGNVATPSGLPRDEVFRAHINQVVSQSVFVGLRSTGAVDSLRRYLDDSQNPVVALQPCPTTIARALVPEIADTDDTVRRIGVQVGLEQAHRASGLVPESLFPKVAELVESLTDDGWQVTFVGHKRTDMAFYRECGNRLSLTPVRLFGSTDVLFRGLDEYAKLPIVLGARGHSQMIPFGLGNVPLSLATNDKIRFFAREIGHPEWLVDPWQPDFSATALHLIRSLEPDLTATRAELQVTRQRFLETTLTNLATIYERITGVRPQAEIVPYSPERRSRAEIAYADDYRRREATGAGEPGRSGPRAEAGHDPADPSPQSPATMPIAPVPQPSTPNAEHASDADPTKRGHHAGTLPRNGQPADALDAVVVTGPKNVPWSGGSRRRRAAAGRLLLPLLTKLRPAGGAARRRRAVE